MLAVTSEGARFRARLGKRMATPPAPVADLSRGDQEALRDILRRALED
jgi:hypothetical protein